MTTNETCPHCGAAKRSDYPIYFLCGTHVSDTSNRRDICYQRELKAQAAEIERLQDALRDIAELAHDKSTGPAVPDTCWEIRRMAYDAVEK